MNRKINCFPIAFSIFLCYNDKNTKIRRQRRVVNSYLSQRAKDWWDFGRERFSEWTL